LTMPRMSGTDLLARLRRDHPAVPVVAVSAAVNPSRVVPFDGHLAKPFDYETLWGVLRDVVQKRPALIRQQCGRLRGEAARSRGEAARSRSAARAVRLQSAAIVYRSSCRRASAAAAA